MPPLEALAADLLALLEGPAWPGTAVPHAVPAAVPVCASENSLICNDLQMLGPLGPLGPRKTDESGNVQTDEPTTHCHACGAPSWWLSPEGWCCAYCVPRPHPFLGASLVIAAAWADGCAPALDEEPGHPAELDWRW